MKNLFTTTLIAILITSFMMPKKANEKVNVETLEFIKINKIDSMPQVIFWRKIMNLSGDSCIVNLHKSRTILSTMNYSIWDGFKGDQKLRILDSLRGIHCLIDSPRIVGTQGKNYFYTFEKLTEKIPTGMKAFENNAVDGWYAKAILLIESPNQLQRSPAGAYGAFQLMPSVARKFGLTVNKKTDERANFNRSAFAASALIKTICIPYAKSMLYELDSSEINENDLWFKLLVMHVYNAGAGNVRSALLSIPEPKKDMDLIYQLWNTNYGRFQNSSQNYSQLILAAFLEYEVRVESKISNN